MLHGISREEPAKFGNYDAACPLPGVNGGTANVRSEEDIGE